MSLASNLAALNSTGQRHVCCTRCSKSCSILTTRNAITCAGQDLGGTRSTSLIRLRPGDVRTKSRRPCINSVGFEQKCNIQSKSAKVKAAELNYLQSVSDKSDAKKYYCVPAAHKAIGEARPSPPARRARLGHRHEGPVAVPSAPFFNTSHWNFGVA
jgi:hypothetical protein